MATTNEIIAIPVTATANATQIFIVDQEQAIVDPTEKNPQNQRNGRHCLFRVKPSILVGWNIMMTSIRRFFTYMEFKYVKLAQLLCGVYILTVTFTYIGQLGIFGGARDPNSGGYIVDPISLNNTVNGIIEITRTSNSGSSSGHTFTRAVVASTRLQMVLLGLAAFTAFFMYPAIVLVFWTKCRALQSLLVRNKTRCLHVFCISDTHHLHSYCGWTILICSLLHTMFHFARWAVQGNLYLVFGSTSGITGVIVIVSTLIVVLPMTVLKRHLKFEVRKYLHYVFFTVFAVAMCFHAPIYALPRTGFCVIIFPALMVVYALDALYARFYMRERIANVKYETVATGTQLSMKVSDRFVDSLDDSGGYVYICFDWLTKHQWHAFSIYVNPLDHTERHVFIAKNGDWTNKVHETFVLQDPNNNTVRRTLSICGPFPSPYMDAVKYDNMVLVAAGIGITAALSAIHAFRDSRRVNLIWATRDASQLVFFLENATLDHKGFNLIFYTGKDPLPDTIENYHSTAANLSIIRARPNLAHVLPGIIAHIDQHGQQNQQLPVELPTKDDLALCLVKAQAEQHKQKQPHLNPTRRVALLTSYAKKELGHDLAQLIEKKNHHNQHIAAAAATTCCAASCVVPDDGGGFGGEDVSDTEALDDSYSHSHFGEPHAETKSSLWDLERQAQEDDDDDKDDVAALEFLAALERISKCPSDILVHERDARFDCDLDLVAYLHDRHSSVWKTNGEMADGGGCVDACNKPAVWEHNAETRPYVQAMLEDQLSTWGLLYCGGRNKLLESLRKESKKLNIPLHEEAFDW